MVSIRPDYARLAGEGTLLGLDLSESSATIVQLRKHGSLLHKYRAEFSSLSALFCQFPPDCSVDQKGAIIRQALSEHRLKTRLCAATCRTSGVRSAAVTVPPEVQDFGDWVHLHAPQILKLPIALTDLEIRWDILESTPSGTQLDITFVRNQDLKDVREIIQAAGLELIALSAGVRDVANPLLVLDKDIAQKEVVIAHVDGQRTTLVPLSRGRRKALTIEGSDEELQRNLKTENSVFMWAGSWLSRNLRPNDLTLEPFGLESTFALASGLAIKGFLPELSRLDFLSPEEQETRKARLWERGAKRMAAILGSVLFFLLAVQALATWALQSTLERLDSDLASSNSAAQEVRILEEEVQSLEALQARSVHTARAESNMAGLLHHLASAVPGQLRIDHLTSSFEGAGVVRVALSASARTRETVTAFIRQLEGAGFTGVRLKRLATNASTTEPTAPPSGLLRAEIEASIQRETLGCR